MLKRALCVAALALGVCVAGPAVAATETHLLGRVRLTWSAPDACPRAHEVTARMARLLAQSTEPHPELVAEANVSSDGAAFALEMRIWQADRPAYRRLRATTCRELSDAAALLLALLVDPALQIDSDPPPASPGPRRATPAPPRPVARARERVHGAGVVWGASGSAVLDWVALSAPAPGLRAAVSGELGRLRLELGAIWLPLATHVTRDGAREPEKGGKFRLIAGSARACHAWLVAPRLSACAAGELGSLRGAGFGTANDRHRSVVWAAAGPGVAAAIAFAESAAFTAGADLLFVLNRPRFELENVGLVHRPPAAGFRLAAGVELNFR
jgi:hypothetical protein